MITPEEELQLVMWYTGWSKGVAMAAIRQWKEFDISWNGAYIARYK